MGVLNLVAAYWCLFGAVDECKERYERLWLAAFGAVNAVVWALWVYAQ